MTPDKLVSQYSGADGGEVAAQILLGDLQARRQALDDHGQLRPMRLARGQKSKH